MKASKLAIGFAAVAILSSQLESRAGIPVMVFLPAVSHPWSVAKEAPYALWYAQSTNAQPAQVEVDEKNDVVDSAAIKPQSLYASNEDLTKSGKVWLPKGGLLVKMSGGAGSWFCTWRFDDKSEETQVEADNDNLSGFGEYNLCMRSDSNGTLIKPTIMIADFKSLMAITGSRLWNGEI